MESTAGITQLLFKHLRDELNQEESAYLRAWVGESDVNRQFFDSINNEHALMADVRAYEEVQQIDMDAAWTRLTKFGRELPGTTQPKKIDFRVWLRNVAAVLVVVVSLISLFVLLFHHAAKKTAAPVVAPFLPGDATPNSNHAYLTRYNGDTIALEDFSGNLDGDQGSIKVIKNYTCELSYAEVDRNRDSEPLYNMVTVPKGGNVVKLQLSDGTKVWLNSESSITYPVAFNEEERHVKFNGEAYFEVAHSNRDKEIPFIVTNGNMTISALGTKFNVNAYLNEEDKKVTLLEGRVKVQNEQGELIVEPGQQAVLNKERISLASTVDVDQVMAWKNGLFHFDNTDIQTIMRQMERWYDLDPTWYENESVKKWAFNGEVSRYANASKVLQLLEKTGAVQFQIEGKKIIVSQ